MARVRLILFDIDGTLVNTGGAGRRALLVAFEQLFSPESLDGADKVPFAGNTDGHIFSELARVLRVPAERLQGRRVEFEQAYGKALHRELRREDGPPQCVLPGVLPLLETLALRDDARVGLLTGNIATGARLKLARFDLNRFFEGGGFGDNRMHRREVARVARDDMAERCGLEFAAPDVTVIGDTDQDVDCARFNGFRSVAVNTGWAGPGSLVAARPDALFDDLSETDSVLTALFAD